MDGQAAAIPASPPASPLAAARPAAGPPSPGVPPAVSARRAALETLASERFDVLVVGGGIVGAGALLDAASRGLRAALIEQTDIAAGTSSRSSRLIHGGLRYLEQLHLGLVAEALDERARLLRLAPHLVRLEPFLFPIYGLPLVHQGFYGAGIFLYDLLGSRHGAGFATHMRPGAAREFAPQLRPDGLRAGILYHDGVEDDARLALAVLRTALATGPGAVAATRVRADAPLLEDGRAIGVRARDLATGAPIEIRAARVVDATGAWAAHPEERFAPVSGAVRIVPSRGAHIVIRRDRLQARGGMTLRIPGRVVFIVPWPDRWIIGTTDHEDARPPARPTALDEDVDELLEVVNHRLDIGLTRTDILAAYAGFRPLVGDAGGSTVKASREHKVTTDPTGVVRIGGGKYTTYRVMARDTIDAALGREEARRRPSATAELPLVGAARLESLGTLATTIARQAGLSDRVARRLVDRHGTEAAEVVALGRELDLLRPIAGDVDHLEAEVAWAARAELGGSIDDVLSRRTRVAQERADHGAAFAPRVAEILGAELGWDAAVRAAEVARYVASSAIEYAVPPGAATRGGAPAAEPSEPVAALVRDT
ncbi:MAG TPA: glycerol-3-phosphate dehydrogenase/oxidase [Candidatus Limnocylindrales bacterium]|nr:glycerol-3-phosphate dehydrogenase/oxidase [Candidatus Limnocylindrales bacterium]